MKERKQHDIINGSDLSIRDTRQNVALVSMINVNVIINLLMHNAFPLVSFKYNEAGRSTFHGTKVVYNIDTAIIYCRLFDILMYSAFSLI